MRPKGLKKALASSILVFPGIMPQKQGTAQSIGSFRRGWIVSIAFTGSKVSSGVGVAVDEGITAGKITVTVGMEVSILVLAGAGVKAEIVVVITGGIV